MCHHGRWIGLGIATVLALGAGWLWHLRAGPPVEPAPPVSALVQVAPIVSKTLPETVTALADVIAGPPYGLNFIQAGRVNRVSVVAGQQVRRGDVLAALDIDPNIALAFVQAQHAAQLTDAEWKRLVSLRALRLATDSQVDAAAKAHQDAVAAVETQRALGAGSASATLRAPFDAVVLSVLAATGDRIAAGAPLVQLAAVSAMKARIGIEPAQARRVIPGMKASLVPLDWPDARVDALVSQVQASIDPKTQLVDVLADVAPTPAVRLVPGVRLRATLILSERPGRVVPRSAVLSDEKGHYVFQIDGNTAHRVPVTLGVEAAGTLEVTGVDPTKPVVTVGNYELEDGMTVRVQKP